MLLWVVGTWIMVEWDKGGGICSGDYSLVLYIIHHYDTTSSSTLLSNWRQHRKSRNQPCFRGRAILMPTEWKEGRKSEQHMSTVQRSERSDIQETGGKAEGEHGPTSASKIIWKSYLIVFMQFFRAMEYCLCYKYALILNLLHLLRNIWSLF